MFDLQKNYTDAVNGILSNVKFPLLSRSCNGHDIGYAKEVLQKLHQAFVDTYGSDCIKSVYGDFLDVPAVIQGIKTGNIALGLVTLDLSSSGEHWGTAFFTEHGVIDQCDENLSAASRKYLQEYFGSYNYWYTPEIPGDIHVDFENLPGKVQTLLSACTGFTPTQPTEGMTAHVM